MELELSKVADTLMSQAAIFNCSIEKAWKEWMHPRFTEVFTFEEVKKYIDQKTALGEFYSNDVLIIHDAVKALNLEGDAFGKTLMDIYKEGK